jgi:hypothetical protein
MTKNDVVEVSDLEFAMYKSISLLNEIYRTVLRRIMGEEMGNVTSENFDLYAMEEIYLVLLNRINQQYDDLPDEVKKSLDEINLKIKNAKNNPE